MQNFMDKLISKATQRSSMIPKYKTIVKDDPTPDISISRDPGSGGRIVAKKVAEKLKWKFFDRELMIKLAKDLGIPAKEFEDVDEHTRNWVYDTFHSLLNPNYVSDLKYIANLKKLLLHAAKSSDIVVVGRGANHILNPSMCLRVRVTASFSTRVENTVKHEGKTKEEAESWVRHVEEKRVGFIKQYFGVNPYNPWHYDLVINTDTITLDQARDIIIEAYFTKFPSERKRLKYKS